MTGPEDRSWMYAPRWPRTWVPLWFEVGVNEFIEFCLKHPGKMRGPDKVKCPCVICHNTKFQTIDMCKVHLYKKGFVEGYHCWIHQGESPEPLLGDNCNPPPVDPYTHKVMDAIAQGPTPMERESDGPLQKHKNISVGIPTPTPTQHASGSAYTPTPTPHTGSDTPTPASHTPGSSSSTRTPIRAPLDSSADIPPHPEDTLGPKVPRGPTKRPIHARPASERETGRVYPRATSVAPQRCSVDAGGNIQPSNPISRYTTTRIFPERVDPVHGMIWSKISEDVYEFYWTEFKKAWYWDTDTSEATVKRAWTTLAGKAYGNKIYRDRANKRKPFDDLPDEDWQRWLDFFDSDPHWVRRQHVNRKNRRSGADPSVPAAGTHTAGARSFSRVRDDLTAVQGGTRATIAATYIAMHARHKRDEAAQQEGELEWVNPTAAAVFDLWVTLVDRASQQLRALDASPVNEDALLVEAARNHSTRERSRRLFGFGSHPVDVEIPTRVDVEIPTRVSQPRADQGESSTRHVASQAMATDIRQIVAELRANGDTLQALTENQQRIMDDILGIRAFLGMPNRVRDQDPVPAPPRAANDQVGVGSVESNTPRLGDEHDDM